MTFVEYIYYSNCWLDYIAWCLLGSSIVLSIAKRKRLLSLHLILLAWQLSLLASALGIIGSFSFLADPPSMEYIVLGMIYFQVIARFIPMIALSLPAAILIRPDKLKLWLRGERYLAAGIILAMLDILLLIYMFIDFAFEGVRL